MPDIYLYSNADFGLGPGLGPALDIYLNAGSVTVVGTPDIASISDDDPNFDDDRAFSGQVQDPGLNQVLLSDLVLDGVTVGTTGQPIYNAAESQVTNVTTGEVGRLLYVTLDDGTGNNWAGFASTIPLNPGDDLTISVGSFIASEPYDNIVCFGRGTQILTSDGLSNVEDIVAGDLIETKDHGLQSVKWIGSATVRALGALAPIVFPAGAIGNTRTMVLSPQHRILLETSQAEVLFGEPEVLIPAKHFVGHHGISRREGGDIEYYHILFADHEIVFSDGVLSESFQPCVQNIAAFDVAQRKELLEIFPDLRGDGLASETAAYRSLRAFESTVLLAQIGF